MGEMNCTHVGDNAVGGDATNTSLDILLDEGTETRVSDIRLLGVGLGLDFLAKGDDLRPRSRDERYSPTITSKNVPRGRLEDLANGLNPCLNGAVGGINTSRRGNDGCSNATTSVMTHEDDVLHTELSDSVGKDGLSVGVGGVVLVSDVALGEESTRLSPEDGSFANSAVGTSQEHERGFWSPSRYYARGYAEVS
jgi:hypothetical protein